jgi:excisionase family DNA binding protein
MSVLSLTEVAMASPPAPLVPDGEVEDVAQLLKVSERSVYRLAASGEIPSYRVGGKLRFDLSEIAAAVRATRRPA